MNETKYYKIGYGCGCGEMEDYIIALNQKEADMTAYQSAIENQESYEGLHGIRGMAEIAEEDFDVNLDELDYNTGDYAAIEEAYIEERESQLDYWAEEISEREYLIGVGELDEEDDDE